MIQLLKHSKSCSFTQSENVIFRRKKLVIIFNYRSIIVAEILFSLKLNKEANQQLRDSNENVPNNENNGIM